MELITPPRIEDPVLICYYLEQLNIMQEAGLRHSGSQQQQRRQESNNFYSLFGLVWIDEFRKQNPRYL